LLLVLFTPTLDLVAALPPLAAGTFPTGTIVVPMDDKQADRIRVYGLIHEFLASRTDAEIARIIEPPDVTMQTALTPSGTTYQGGPVLIDQKFLPSVNSLLTNATFSKVTITRLTAPFTSNHIFFVRQPTKILVIKGIWGRTDYTLNRMGISYTLVNPPDVEKNPAMLKQYSLIVVDCPGWFGNPSSFSPDKQTKVTAIYDTIKSHVQAGNEVIYTDIAIRDLNVTFPGYVEIDRGGAGSWAAKVYNPPNPAGRFSGEFPSQYYNAGPNPNDIKVVTEGGGWVASSVQPAHTSDVRILIDSNKFGVPYRYAILGFYFEFGAGIVEGLAFHPQEQIPSIVGEKGFYAVHQIYGNKFVHGPQVDFFVTAVPGTVTVAQGQIANYTVTVTSVGSFSSPVSLQVSGLPANSTSSFAPVTVTPAPGGSVSSTLKVFTTFSTPNGTYPLTITGISTLPAITRSTNVTLVVTLARPDFVLTANPTDITVNLTKCGNVSASVRSLGTFNSPVNLTLTGLPAHVASEYIPNPVTPPIGGTVFSTLRLCPAYDATPGNYTLTVVGTSTVAGTPLVHTVNVVLRIPKPIGPNILIYLLVLLLLLLALALALLAAYLSRKRKRAPFVVVPMRPVKVRPRVQYVMPLPTIRCRWCCRIIPLHSVYCPYCGRPQVVMARPPPKMVAPRIPRATRKSIVAFALSLVAGILVILNSAALLSPGFWGAPTNWSGIFWWLPSIGQSYAFALGFIIGLVLIMGSLVLILGHGALADVIIFPFAVFSMIIGGGFVAGMVLGIVGGIIGALKR